jgi:inner membrane protease subunit 2
MSSRFSRLFKQANAHASLLRDTSFYLFGFATWLPAFIFFNSHVAELSWINGASMYPYLNTDYNKNLKRDLCLNWKWKPLDGLRRGMIVTFWSVPFSPPIRHCAFSG